MTKEIIVPKEEVRRDHFYVLKIHEDRSRNPAILVITKAPDEIRARRYMASMRPKKPVVNPKEWNILDVYDTEDMSDMRRMQLHDSKFGEAVFYIEKTKVGTFYPHDISVKLANIKYRKNTTQIVHVMDKHNSKEIGTNIQFVEDKLQKYILSTKTASSFYSEKEGDQMVQTLIETNQNICFVLYSKTMGELISFARKMYNLTEGCRITLQFFYLENENLFECNFTDTLTMEKVSE